MNKRKKKLYLEYPLTTKSYNIVWEHISTVHGLERWIADHVEDMGDDIISLTWGEVWTDHHTLQAKIVERDRNDHIRLRWVNEEDPEAYWEMRIAKSEVTNLLTLLITDFADEEDTDALKILWESNLDRLHRASGL